MLMQHGLLNGNDANISNLSLDLLQLDDDLLSMELPNNFANHLLQDDDTYKVYVQSSL